MTIVLNGDLGSGKSTVAILLAQRLGLRRVSVGELYRQVAEQRGMTALELNRHAELDDTVDAYVDQLQRDIAASGEPLVVDSRLAWFFFRDALKVHLITDPVVAALRVLGRPADTVEGYASVAEAVLRLAERSESERARFQARYGADKTRLRNYDLVCDSTRATPAEIVDRIVEALPGPGSSPQLYLDPQRLVPAAGPVGGTVVGSIEVRYERPRFLVVSGQRAVDDAVHAGRTLVPAVLSGDSD